MAPSILILCTHNSARSVLAEAMLNHWAGKLGADIRAASAGSHPSGRINPLALEVLSNAGVSNEALRSKSWGEFANASASPLRLVITVCDNAAGEVCPLWPGAPVKAHWGYPDPSDASGRDEGKRAAFELTRQAIGYRMLQLSRLPWRDLSDVQLREAVAAISAS